MSVTYLSEIEAGKKPGSAEALRKLAETLEGADGGSGRLGRNHRFGKNHGKSELTRSMTLQHTLRALCATVMVAFGSQPPMPSKNAPRRSTDRHRPAGPGLRHRLGFQHRAHDDLRAAFQLDSHLQPKPQMVAVGACRPDALTWRFTLRPGLRFHDGQPVTTTDVIASMRRWMDFDGGGRKLAADLTSMDAIDDATFTMSLKQPFPSMLATLAAAPIPVRRHHAGQGPDGPAQARHHSHRLGSIPLRPRRAGERRQDRVESAIRITFRATNRPMEQPAAGS